MIINITGIGWVTASNMGCGKDHDRFALPDGSLPVIEQRELFERPYPSFRRMDEYSKLGIAAIAFALKDADLDQWTHKRNIGIIVSTEYGCLGVDLDFYGTVLREEGIGASPALFAYTLPNSFLGDAAILFGLTGKAFVINPSLPLGLAGLKLAMDSLLMGECDQILCGANNLKHPPPFDRHGKAAPGALFFVVEKAGRTSAYGKLSFIKKGMVEFEGKEVQDLSEIVRRCLAR
ncbi:MAG: beta-ketoacyl synthase N-terminal-like domain-containing protein [Desulfobacterales bacterium]|nr:beta-ketoacyl synthase N-terminal-like domain-containing protein [Desulfobacterales bacterium]